MLVYTVGVKIMSAYVWVSSNMYFFDGINVVIY